MKTFSNIFHSTFCWGRKYLNIFYISFIFYCWQQVLFKLIVSSLLSTLNDASVDIVDDEDSFEFSFEAEFILALYFHITLVRDTEPEWLYLAQLLQLKKYVEVVRIQVAFKRVIAWNRMIRGIVNLTICLS